MFMSNGCTEPVPTPHSLLHSWEWTPPLTRALLESWKKQQQQQQFNNHADPYSGLWVGPLQHLPHLWTTDATEENLQDLNDTGQQDLREKPQFGSSIDNVAETRGLGPHQWHFAIKISKLNCVNKRIYSVTMWLTVSYKARFIFFPFFFSFQGW